MRKRILVISAPLFLVIMIASNSTLAIGATATRDWDVNEATVIRTSWERDETIYNKTLDLTHRRYSKNEHDDLITIIAIDEDLEIVVLNITPGHDGIGGVREYPYNGNDLTENSYGFTTNNFFATYYVYNSETRNTYLTHFYFNFYLVFFLEVDWSIFNNNFEKILNDGNIVDTVPTSYGEKQITVAEFLGSLSSYTICGKSTLEQARKQFTNIRTKWEFTFDLTGVIYFSDPEENEFTLYDKYIITFYLDYSNGGTLKNHQTIREYRYETENISVEGYTESAISFGSGERILPIPMEFLAVGFSVVAIVIIQIRKKIISEEH